MTEKNIEIEKIVSKIVEFEKMMRKSINIF